MNRDLRFESAIAFARDIIRIPSASGEEKEVAERVVEEVKRLKFDDVWIDEIGNVLARVKGTGDAPPIMLCSHLDVVDAGEPSQWECPPFSGEIAGGYLHGRGSVDCKGPLALQTYAAAALLDSRPAGDVYLACTVFEESGSWGMAHIMEQKTVQPAAVILGEATDGDICIGHRGRKEVKIIIHGKAAHASAPHRGSNPVNSLPSVLAALNSFADEIPSHSVLCPSTLVPTIIETWPRSPNMIPEQVRIVIDWRTLPYPQNPVDALRSFLKSRLDGRIVDSIDVQEQSEMQTAYTGLNKTASVSTSSFLLAASHPVVEAATGAVTTALGYKPATRPWIFGTDGGCSCGIHDIPTIGFAPGREECAHTNLERLRLEGARTAYDAYPALMRAVQQSLASGIAFDSVAAAG